MKENSFQNMKILEPEEFQCRREFPDDGEELWTPLVYHGIIRLGYYISHIGRVYGKRGIMHGKDAYKKHDGIYKNWGFNLGFALGQNGGRHIPIAPLMMEAFKPVRFYAPEYYNNDRLKEYNRWKNWVEEGEYFFGAGCATSFFTIDHIDDNPRNNHINNLQYLLTRDNNEYRKPVAMHGVSPKEAINLVNIKRAKKKLQNPEVKSEAEEISTLDGFLS